MKMRKLSQWTIILIVIMLLLAGCGGQKYALKCNITTQDFGFEITGEDETGTVTQTSNNEATNYEYDPSGQTSGITVSVNRDLVFENNQHKYHIEGTIKLNPITNELTYDITGTGDTFGNAPQTCKSGAVEQSQPSPIATSTPIQATNTSIPTPAASPTAPPTDIPPTLKPAPIRMVVTVQGDASWVDTGLEIQAGQRMALSATGTVQTESRFHEESGPDGKTWLPFRCPSDDNPRPCLLDGLPYGLLIGRIGEGDIFPIGSFFARKVSSNGTLYLAINDNIDYFDDNAGFFEVEIIVQSP